MKTEIVLQDICKNYGKKQALKHLNLTIPRGMFGLLGRNGAGKTTLMKILVTLLPADGGTVTVCGTDIRKRKEIRAMTGYLPQDFGYYPDFTGTEFLLYMAALKGLNKACARRKAAELLEVVGLEDMGRKKIRTYSGGMKQRLGIAQALLGEPGLLILDEPTAGLDPRERVRFRELIAQWGKENIVLLSTHIVSDVAHIADTILMMKGGELIYQGVWEEQEDLETFYLERM